MPQSFQTISHKNIAKGMDTRSSLNSIQEGYAELARNMNTNSSGFVEKRKGYQGYYGDLPLRLQSSEVEGATLRLIFDAAYDFTGVTPRPLVGYGSHNVDGSREDDLEIYWPTFINPIFFKPLIGDNLKDNASGTTNNLIGVVQSITATTNSRIFTDESKFTDSQITHTLSLDDKDVSLFTADLSTNAGEYSREFSNGDFSTPPVVVANESTTFVFDESEHNLENLNIVPQLFKKIAGEYVFMKPESIKITDLGAIEVVIANQEVGTNTYKIVIFDVDGNHSHYSTLSSHTFTNVPKSFNFASVLVRTAGGLFNVIPDEAIYDSVAKTLTISLDDITGITDINYMYMEGINPSNVLKVDLPSDWEDTANPEFVIYGISQASIVGNLGGESTCLEEYSTVGVSDLVVSMNGNFYTDNSKISTPITSISMDSRTDGLQTIGPFFGTRGIQASNVSGGEAIVKSIHNLRNGQFKVDLDLGVISSGSFALLKSKDTIKISGANYASYNGVFEIIDYDDSSLVLSHPTLGPTVPAEKDVDGVASINSDSILMLDASVYQVGDIIESSLFPSAPKVVAIDGNELYIDNISSDFIISGSSKFSVTRTTDTIPLDSVVGFLTGDMIEVENFTRLFQVLSVDVAGSKIVIDESIEVSSSETKNNYVKIQGRWFPIEAPDLNDPILYHMDEDPTNMQKRIRAASTADSLFLSNYNDEVMKYDGDSIYQAGIIPWNPVSHSWIDEGNIVVPKFSYISIDSTGADAVFTFPTAESMPEYSDEMYFYDNSNWSGTFVPDSYTVKSYDTVAKTITISKDVVSSGSLSEDVRGDVSIPRSFSYYFKLQAIDRNSNLVASAVTNPTDCTITINKSGSVHHRLIGLPKFGNLDYDRLDLMMYRTKAGTSAPFYEVRRFPIDYNSTRLASSTIYISDNTSDSSFDNPDDSVSIAIKGADFPLSSREPARAKYLAGVNSRLIQGNIRGYSELDVTLRSESGIEVENVLGWNSPNTGTGAILPAVLDIEDGENSIGFKFIAPLAQVATFGDMNETNIRRITNIGSAVSPSQVTLTCSPALPADMQDKWIQVDSFHVDAVYGSYFQSTTTNPVPKNAHYIGWWKVVSQAGNDIVIETSLNGVLTGLNLGGTTDGSNDALYIAFDDKPLAESRIPIIAHPYSINPALPKNVTKLNYRDNQNSLELTSAVHRGVIDLRVAINQVQSRSESPWLYANSGGTYGSGRIVLRSTKPSRNLTFQMKYGNNTDLNVFCNGVKVTNDQQVSGRVPTFPSRILVSSQNFPEIMDNPYAFSSVDSDSVVDINADDGEEITGLSSFFAISASGASQVEDTLIVFKSRGVYNVTLSTGNVSRLESQGQGCTVPDSIESTSDGIMFANESGIYVVTPSLQVRYVGKAMEGYWNGTNKLDLSSSVGFLDSVNRKYKLSVPLKGSKQNSEVLVYDYIRDEESGAWTYHDNISASAWEQRGSDVVFGTYSGRVYKIRDSGDVTDYRDDAQGISSTFIYAPQDFGDSGTRKDIGRIETHFGAETPATEIRISSAVDIGRVFTQLDFTSFTGIDKKVYTIASSISDKHCVFIQVKYDHDTKDENLKIVGIDYKVKALEELGIDQA